MSDPEVNSVPEDETPEDEIPEETFEEEDDEEDFFDIFGEFEPLDED